jgi:hypothetical protein
VEAGLWLGDPVGRLRLMRQLRAPALQAHDLPPWSYGTASSKCDSLDPPGEPASLLIRLPMVKAPVGQ